MAFGKEVGTKLSVKSFGFDKERLLELVMANKGVDVPLVRFTGAATGLRKYKSEYADGGEGLGLAGQFEGQSVDGEVKNGSVLYLPKNVHDMVEAALSMADDILSVRIAFDVYARYDKDAATSYVFVVRDILNEGGQSVEEVKEAIKEVPALGSDSTIKKLK
jgi:hypothetical protein